MNRKPRILFCSEASFLSTGFAVYALEVLSRLNDTGKFELAELGAYGKQSDPRAKHLPWTYYGVMPEDDDERGKEVYNSSNSNQFGRWKFEEACLKFRPDVVVAYKDPWMDAYIFTSPFRQFFHLAAMPTVDSIPLQDEWVADYLSADGVFAYCDWGLEQLVRQGGRGIKAVAATPPGADLSIFTPVSNKAAHKREMGLPEDSFVVGTVMRNQARKLFPDLIEAFSLFCQTAPRKLAQKTFLYLHTSHPDIGWDIPRLIRESGLGHKIYLTYACGACGMAFPSLYQDVKGICKNCGQGTAILPGSMGGVTQQFLARVYNLFDAHVQYSVAEGLGMPQLEAAACAVPVFAVDYSAMSDVVRKVKGIPIKVERFFREPGTHAFRAYPDNKDFAQKLIRFLSAPSDVREKMRFDARKGVEEHFTYERTAKIWTEYFDSLSLPEQSQTWLSPPCYHQPAQQIPDGLSNEQFVKWCMVNVAGRPDLAHSYLSLKMTKELHWGCTMVGTGGLAFNEASMLGLQPRWSDFTREHALKVFLGLAQHKNEWEQRRSQAGNAHVTTK